MSSSEALQRIRRANRRGSAFRALAAAVLLAPLAAACADGGATGFRPVYGSLGGTSRVQDKFARVDVTTIPGRNGQRIRNELIFAATGGGRAQPPAYRLDTSIRESATTSLVSTDGNSAAQIFQIDATFRLVDLKDGRTLLQGTSHGRAAAERVTSIYSNVRSADDAQDRAAKSVATDMKARLEAFLSTLPD